MKRTPKAWNGSSPEAARAAANQRRDAAAAQLRAAYQQTAARDPWLCDAPFRDAGTPGWVYLPVEDCVILAETARRLLSAIQIASALRQARTIIAADIMVLEDCHSRGATGRREDIDAANLGVLAPYDAAVREIDRALLALEHG
jgi:hypothetical protein